MLAYLTSDVAFLILANLDYTDLVAMSCVSKRFSHLALDDKVWQRHLDLRFGKACYIQGSEIPCYRILPQLLDTMKRAKRYPVVADLGLQVEDFDDPNCNEMIVELFNRYADNGCFLDELEGIERGDLVDISPNGDPEDLTYRLIYDGEHYQALAYHDQDGYLALPKGFDVVTEFPVGYWSQWLTGPTTLNLDVDMFSDQIIANMSKCMTSVGWCTTSLGLYQPRDVIHIFKSWFSHHYLKYRVEITLYMDDLDHHSLDWSRAFHVATITQGCKVEHEEFTLDLTIEAGELSDDEESSGDESD